MREPIYWVVVSPYGVCWLGTANDENCAWKNALGWPDIANFKKLGWYAVPANVTWQKPTTGETK